VRTEVIRVDAGAPDPAAIERAAELVERGGIVAFPTETVYGIGCLAAFEQSVARIYALKGRPPDRPLPVCLAEPGDIFRHAASVSDEARRLIARYLPGPLTVVLADRAGATTGFRVSPHPVLRALLKRLGAPLVGTSANPSGAPSPTTPDEVLAAFEGRIEAVLDAGTARLGIDSSVIDCTTSPPTLLREGALSARELGAVLGVELQRPRPSPQNG
jgi:L-threonylcarbamoyladenylate synthase